MSNKILEFRRKSSNSQKPTKISRVKYYFNSFETAFGIFYGKFLGSFEGKTRVLSLDEVLGLTIRDFDQNQKIEIAPVDYFKFLEKLNKINERLHFQINPEGIYQFPRVNATTISTYNTLDCQILWVVTHREKRIHSTMRIYSETNDKAIKVRTHDYTPPINYTPQETHFYNSNKHVVYNSRKKIFGLF